MNTDWLATGKPRGHFMCVSCPRRSPRFLAQSNSYRMNTVLPHGLILAKNILALEPTLRPGLAGAWHFPGDAHLRPDRLLQSWRDSLVERDVKILENTALQELVFNDGRPIAARTTRGKIVADHFVFATGAFTPQLSSQLGWSPPIQPAKGYSLTMPRPEHCPNYPLNLVDYGVVATPWSSGYRLGSILEFSGYNRKIDPRRVALLRTGANECL